MHTVHTTFVQKKIESLNFVKSKCIQSTAFNSQWRQTLYTRKKNIWNINNSIETKSNQTVRLRKRNGSLSKSYDINISSFDISSVIVIDSKKSKQRVPFRIQLFIWIYGIQYCFTIFFIHEHESGNSTFNSWIWKYVKATYFQHNHFMKCLCIVVMMMRCTIHRETSRSFTHFDVISSPSIFVCCRMRKRLPLYDESLCFLCYMLIGASVQFGYLLYFLLLMRCVRNIL